MHISESIRSGRFVVTCELTPPKGVNIQNFVNAAEMVKNYADAIVVTDNQRAVMRVAPLALCQALKTRNIEPVMELSTRDRNRLSLQSELLGAAVLGIENVLLVTGHEITIGDHIDAKPVHDLDCTALVKAATTLTQGKDMTGHALEGAPRLCIGVEVMLRGKASDEQLTALREQVSMGAQFIITHPIYEPDVLHGLMESVSDLHVPVIVGHMMLRSASMARFMNTNLPGVHVPDALIGELEGLPREELPARSLQLSIDLLNKMKPLCDGMHLMPGGWERYVPRIVDAVLG